MPKSSNYKLNLILTPSNALIDSKIYSSSNPSVATVTNDGMVTGISEGHALITVDVNGTHKKTIDVYVGNYDKPEIIVSPDSIDFNTNEVIIKVGSKDKINYTITPNNINYKGLHWESSDKSIVTVDNNGVIKGISVGEAIVSLSSINGKRADINIKVLSNTVEINDITLTRDTIDMKAGTTDSIVAKISPTNATNKNLSFTSSNNEIVSISVNSDGNSAYIMALKEGTAVITITGGNIEKKVTVNVKGDNSNTQNDTSDNINKTIQVKSNRNNLSTTYEGVKNIGVYGTTSINITLREGVSKIKYCINKAKANVSCTPNINMYTSSEISIPSGDIYVLRIKKYDKDGNEIASTSSNYVDNVLNFFINTTSKEEVKLKQYEITGAYYNSLYSKANPLKINESVNIKVLDNSRHLLVCYTTNTECTPNIKVNSSYKITLNKAGIWRIFIVEYDTNNKKLCNQEVYYAYVIPNEDKPSNTSTNNNYQSTTSVKVKASKLSINNNSVVGKYLSVLVESENKFSEVRFCYKKVNKGSNEICDLDTKSQSIALHSGLEFLNLQEENKTFYGKYLETNSKTLLFDIKALDEIYKASDTNKDIILSFAIGSKQNNKMIYTNPIRVRINMTKKVGIDSYWNSSFIK